MLPTDRPFSGSKTRPASYLDVGPICLYTRFIIKTEDLIPCELPSEICTCLMCRSHKTLPVEWSDV